MLQAITAAITDRLMQTIPDPAGNLAAVKAAAGDSPLWVGTVLSGVPLRGAVEGTVTLILAGVALAAVSLALGALAIVMGVRKKDFPTVSFVATALFLLFALLAGNEAYDKVGRLQKRATTAVAITSARVLIVDPDGRADIPATALTRVTRLNGEQAVTLGFQSSQSLRIEPGSEMFGTLGGAVDRLAEDAGSKAPLRRGTLG